MREVLIYQRVSIYGSVWQNVANHSVIVLGNPALE